MLTFLQLVWLAVAVLVTLERARTLWLKAPVSSAFLAALERALLAGEGVRARSLSDLLPEGAVCRLVRAGCDTQGRVDLGAAEEALLDLQVAAFERLAFLRLAASVSSLLGLLACLVAVAQGSSPQGLLALEAGLPARLSFQRALLGLALGVGSSAFCFDAYVALRRSAQGVLRQLAVTARALEAYPT